mgnify:CR=1 FL=1
MNMYQKMFMSNDYLHETTFGEAVNELLLEDEPVVSVSNYYTVSYDLDYAGDIRVHRIQDEFGTTLWENWNATCWTEAEDQLISDIILWGQL